MRYATLSIVLFGFWLVLSGFFTVGLMTLGALSVVLAVVIAGRMGAVDQEGHPIHLLPGAVTYFPWLIWEIIKSAWNVSRIILDPRLPISPTVVNVRASQRTSTGINVYANSITLTPGTITVAVTDNLLSVHAIVQAGADDLLDGAMDRRVTRFEGAKR